MEQWYGCSRALSSNFFQSIRGHGAIMNFIYLHFVQEHGDVSDLSYVCFVQEYVVSDFISKKILGVCAQSDLQV